MTESQRPGADQAGRSGTISADEAGVFGDIVRGLGRLPEGVVRVDYHFGEDSEGDPAVWFTVVAHEDLKPSKDKIAALQQIAEKVRSEVHRSGSERWPYVEIMTE